MSEESEDLDKQTRDYNKKGGKENMTEKLDFADFSGDYLKALDVQDDKQKFVIIDVIGEENEGRNSLVLVLEYEGRTKKFTLNMTNKNTLQEACKTSDPKEAVGKIITFRIIEVNNPITKQMVKGLRIVFVK